MEKHYYFFNAKDAMGAKVRKMAFPRVPRVKKSLLKDDAGVTVNVRGVVKGEKRSFNSNIRKLANRNSRSNCRK